MDPVTQKRWVISDPIPQNIDDALADFPKFLRQILYNRHYHDPIAAQQYLDGKENLANPFLLQDMGDVVTRLLFAIDQQEPIAVYGDYDVDGVTATALMVEVLEALGGTVRGYIPNRFEEGYGLNNDALDSLAEDGVRVVVTVDCGIRSPREAEHAKSLGIDLIISDHHHPKDDLPDAYGVICPKREGNQYPDQNLSGVGLAYKMAQALLTKRPVNGVVVENWLDLVALGTVADIVPLVGENRSLVRDGLKQIRFGKRQGLHSLARVAGIDVDRITSGDIGFGLGPRLNASGRLETALDSYRLLISKDFQEVGLLAQQLDNQNRERQKLTQDMQREAENKIQSAGLDHLLFAVDEQFNPGVVGLVAAKLTETYYRPSVVGFKGETHTRASCRSISEFHITQALDQCADLLDRHGGHSMAAGFTVKNELLYDLMTRLQRIAERELADKDLRPVLKADMEIPLRELHPDFLNYLDALQPTGLGNPEAVFVSRKLKVVKSRTVGSDGKHLRLTVTDGRITYDAIAFRLGHWLNQMPEMVDLMYTFERNVYQGRVSLQLNVRDLRPSGTAD